MPNHVTTRCKVTGSAEAIKHFKSVLFDNNTHPFDFELIKPMPPLLHQVISPIRRGDHGRTMLDDGQGGLSSPGTEATTAQQAELDKLGSADWYDWANKNWGTKWNSYSIEVLNDEPTFEFKFETAWAFPNPIFEKLSKLFPLLTFDCLTFDEGWNFAAEGQFGAAVQKEFAFCEPTAAMYEAVYGVPPELDDEE